MLIYKSYYFELKGSRFINNYVVDDVGPAYFHRHQSNTFLLRDFSGQLIFTGQNTFSNMRGVSGSRRMSKYLSADYAQQAGLKSFFFNFDRFKMSKLIMKGLRFEENLVYSHKNQTRHKPKLFVFEQAMLYPQLQELLFNRDDVQQDLLDRHFQIGDVEIVDNVFVNSHYMLDLPPLNLTYRGFQIHRNGRRLG